MKKLGVILAVLLCITMLCGGFYGHPRTLLRRPPAVSRQIRTLDRWQLAVDDWFAGSDGIPGRIEHFVDRLSLAVDSQLN